MDSTTIDKVLADLEADWQINRATKEACDNWMKQFSGNDTYCAVAHLDIDQYSFEKMPFTGDDLYYLPPQLLAHCNYPLLYAGVRDFSEQGDFIENFFLVHAAYLWRILNSSGTAAQRAAFGAIGRQIKSASGLDESDDDARALAEAIKQST